MQPRRLTALVALFVICALIAIACDSKQQAPVPETAVLNLAADPETLDPGRATGIPESRVINGLLNGLTRLDANGVAQPSMAEKWESNERKDEWTFHLRPAKWSNGDPVRATDFVWSWQRVLDPALASDYAYQLFFLANAEAVHEKKADPSTLGVKAADEHTLQVKLSGPTTFFPALVAHSAYYPVHRATVEKDADWHTKPASYIGNGPFRLVEWKNNDRIVLEKNSAYWNAADVKLQRIVYRMIEQQTTELAAYEAGDLDMTSNVPRPEIPRLRSRSDLHFGPYFGTYYIGLNCEKAPFNNPLVRRAFALAINRKQIVENITLAGEQVALGWVPASLDAASALPFRKQKPACYADNDVEGARKALAEAGFPGGKGFPSVRYIYNTDENHANIAQALQQMWAQTLGVTVTLENQEWKTYLSNRNAGNFDLSRAAWIADYPDPMNFLEVFLSNGGNNNSRWRNANYDDLLRQAKQTSDENVRFEFMHKAEDLLMQEMPLAPIYYYTNPYLQNERLQNVIMNGMGWQDLTHAWIKQK